MTSLILQKNDFSLLKKNIINTCPLLIFFNLASRCRAAKAGKFIGEWQGAVEKEMYIK